MVDTMLKWLGDYLPKGLLILLIAAIGGSWWVYSVESRLAAAAEKQADTKANYTVIVTKLDDFKKEVQLRHEQDIAFKVKIETKMESIDKNQEKILRLLRVQQPAKSSLLPN